MFCSIAQYNIVFNIDTDAELHLIIIFYLFIIIFFCLFVRSFARSNLTIVNHASFPDLSISFEQPNYIVSEDDGTITVGVVVIGSTSLTLEFG